MDALAGAIVSLTLESENAKIYCYVAPQRVCDVSLRAVWQTTGVLFIQSSSPLVGIPGWQDISLNEMGWVNKTPHPISTAGPGPVTPGGRGNTQCPRVIGIGWFAGQPGDNLSVKNVVAPTLDVARLLALGFPPVAGLIWRPQGGMAIYYYFRSV